MAPDEEGQKGPQEPIAPNTIRTGVRNGTVFMEFAEPVRGVYMSPLEAIVICQNLLQAVVIVAENPQRIIRPS